MSFSWVQIPLVTLVKNFGGKLRTPKPHHHLIHHIVSHAHGITLDQVAAWAGIVAVLITILGIINSSRIKRHYQDKRDEKKFGPIFRGSMSRGKVRREIKWKDKDIDESNSCREHNPGDRFDSDSMGFGYETSLNLTFTGGYFATSKHYQSYRAGTGCQLQYERP